MSESKGFVFSIDATLAVFLFVLVLITVELLTVYADDDPYSKVQTVRLGKDLLFAMDRQGALASGNQSAIEESLALNLPPNTGANLYFETYIYDNGTFSFIGTKSIGEAVPADASTYGARRDFVTMKNGVASEYSKVRLTLWQK